MGKKVSVVPSTKLIQVIGATGYSLPEALGELIDNAIDSHRRHRDLPKTLKVSVEFTQRGGIKRTIIRDEAGGMTEKDLQRAMVIADSDKAGEDIGWAGIGMKSAASSLADHFQIVTVPMGRKKGYRIDFDAKAFAKRDVWEVEIEEVAPPFKHGTEITLIDPRIFYASQDRVVAAKFAQLFQHFLREDELAITINGNAVRPGEAEVFERSRVPIDFKLTNGWRVRGWVGLLKKSSQRNRYGFQLVRHRRVMREHEKIGFHPHPAAARIYGELHLDDFRTNYHKTDFIRGTDEWEEMVKRLTDLLVPVKRQSVKLAHKDTKATALREIEEVQRETNEYVGSDEFAEDVKQELLLEHLGSEADSDDREESDELVENDRLDRPDHGASASANGHATVEERLLKAESMVSGLHIVNELVDGMESGTYKEWQIETHQETKTLIVKTNAQHPFAQLVELRAWMVHNAAEAIGEYLAVSGVISRVLAIKNKVLARHAERMLKAIEEAPTVSASRDPEAYVDDVVIETGDLQERA